MSYALRPPNLANETGDAPVRRGKQYTRVVDFINSWCELLCACAAVARTCTCFCGALYAHVVQRFQHIPAVQCKPVLCRVPKLYFRNPTRDCRLRHRPPAVRRPSRDRSAPSPAKFHRRRVRPQLRESSSYSQTQRLSPTCSEVGTYPANSIYPWSKPVVRRLPFPVANVSHVISGNHRAKRLRLAR
jgi:hypothetical protein